MLYRIVRVARGTGTEQNFLSVTVPLFVFLKKEGIRVGASTDQPEKQNSQTGFLHGKRVYHKGFDKYGNVKWWRDRPFPHLKEKASATENLVESKGEKR